MSIRRLGPAEPAFTDRNENTGIPITEAAFPVPFPSRLEFNPPVHGTWNIVHIGMLLPQAHQIYVCSENCMRGVVMTAAEMNALDRFSCVTLEERDLYNGNLEEITLEGITDVLGKLAARRTPAQMPRAVLVFPVCLHHFMGCDLRYVYGELEKRFPAIRFVHCWMDPIMQKSGPTPDQKLRRAMMDLIPGQKTERSSQSSIPGQKTERSELHSIPGQKTQDRLVFLGDVLALDPESELMRLAKVVNEGFLRSEDGSTGRQIMQIQDCCSLDEYLAMSDAGVIVTRTAVAEPSLRATARRLGAKPMFLPFTFRYEEIREALQGVAALFAADHKPEAETIRKRLAEAGIDFAREEAACEAALADALALIGDTPIAVDQIAVERPLGLCRLLASHGFQVKEVYLDRFNDSEQEDHKWLREHLPSLMVCSTIQPEGRVLHGEGLSTGREHYLAIGPKAAWYNETPHFVNMVYDGGLWGYSGIRKLAADMCDAYLHGKDTRELVPRKGLGCDCIL